MNPPRALLATAMLVVDVMLLGCGSPALPSLPTTGDLDAATEVGDEPEVDAATDTSEAASTGDDAGSTCVDPPPATGAISADCFPYQTCTSCGVAGTDYWCSDDAGAGAHPNLAGCLTDPGAMSGWTGTCCPGSAACVRLSDDDAFCISQKLPGAAWACPVVDAKPTATPTATGCLSSGTTFDAGVPQEPGVPGAALSPAQGNALFCCASAPVGDE